MKFTTFLSPLITSIAITSDAIAGPVNINTASVSELADNIRGVGAKLAQAIIECRQQFGSFNSVDEIFGVIGIGIKVIEDNRGIILVSDDGLESATGVAFH